MQKLPIILNNVFADCWFVFLPLIFVWFFLFVSWTDIYYRISLMSLLKILLFFHSSLNKMRPADGCDFNDVILFW